MPGKRFLYGLTLGGYFGTLFLLLAWYAWLSPPTALPVAIVLAVLLVPLLLPLRGLLHGRRYTFAWSCFLALLYFTHGVMEAWVSEADRALGIAEIVFTATWFGAAILYIRAGKGEEKT